jgi:hypothetical protein
MVSLIQSVDNFLENAFFTQIYSDVLTKPQAEAFICASTGSNFSKFILPKKIGI